MTSDYGRLDALALAELVRTRQATPLELVDEAIRRIEHLNPQLNAIVRPMYDEARRLAKGPLPTGPFTGVPFLLKDLMQNYAGVPTSAGTKLLRDVPMPRDEEIVRRFKAAGVIVVAKTNTPEFGLMPVTEPELFGPARNPWDLSRTPGGSSGGSAAAIAARIVPMAGGNDGGGSIRIPASCCGLVGMKPSRGRVPTGPEAGEIWNGYALDGVMSRSVRDSAAMLDAIAGADVGAPYAAPAQARPFLEDAASDPPRLRIAFTAKPIVRHGDTPIDPECVNGLAATAALLAELGHEVVEAAPDVDAEASAMAFLTIVAGEARAEIEAVARGLGRPVSASDFELATWALGLLGRQWRATDYVNASRYLQTTGRAMGRFFESHDVLLTPTLASPPLTIGAMKPRPAERAALTAITRLGGGWLLKRLGVVNEMAERTFAFIPYTPIFNVTGQPAMSLPLWWTAGGLPVGMQFAAKLGDEATLFRLAGQLERARPWADRVPPLVG